MLLVHGQHLLAEIIQGPDGVQATWMLPGVTGTDLFSFKQKGNLVAGYWGLRGSKQSARTDLKSSPKKAKNHKAQSQLVAEQLLPNGHSLHHGTPTTEWVLTEPHLRTTHLSQA